MQPQSRFNKLPLITARELAHSWHDALADKIYDQEGVAEFVDRLFPALYGAEPSYQLAGVYQ